MKKFRALYIAEDDEQFGLFHTKIERMLHTKGIYANVIGGFTSKDEVEKFLCESRPQLCFFDIFGEPRDTFEKERASAADIANLSIKFPEILFYGLTKESVNFANLGNGFPACVKIISKLHLDYTDEPSPQGNQYLEYISSEILKSLNRCSLSSIMICDNRAPKMRFLKYDDQGQTKFTPIPISYLNSNNIFKDMCKILNLNINNKNLSLMRCELFSLIEGVCVDAAEYYHISEVELELLSGGYSGAIVLSVKINSSSTERKMDVPGVVKISKRHEAMKELNNYQKYVKWTLPYTWRVDVLGHCETYELGAVCYSFVMGGRSNPRPVSDALRVGSKDVVDLAIRKIFNPEAQTWYSTKKSSSKKL